MSWDAYVTNSLVGTGCVAQGAICGHDGSTWATSSGFTISQKEAKAILGAFNDASSIRASGVFANGVKYLTLRTDDTSVYGKKGSGGLCAVKTAQAIVIGVYDEKTQPGQCNAVVEKLGDYLRNSGY